MAAGLFNFLGDRSKGQIAAWARTRAGMIDKELRLPQKGRVTRLARLAQELCGAYELGYLRHVRRMRREAVPL